MAKRGKSLQRVKFLVSMFLSGGFACLAFIQIPTMGFADTATQLTSVGLIPNLNLTSVRVLGIRSDGRYLFYSAGDDKFYVLDLLGMARFAGPFSVSGNILDLAIVDSDQRLIVATTAGAQQFHLDKPLAPEEDTGLAYTRPTNASTTVADACVDVGNKNIYFLETGSGNSTHRIRGVSGKTELSNPAFDSIFPGAPQLSPLAIRCVKDNPMALATYDGNPAQFWAGGLSGGSVDISNGLTPNYAAGDYILSEKKDQLYVMYNRVTGTGAADDAVVRVVSSSRSIVGTYPIGIEGKAMFNYFDGDALFDAFFVGQDRLENASPLGTDRLLVAAGGTFNFTGTKRGLGLSTAGTSQPTRFVSSKKDHYRYVVTDGTGIQLFSKAPALALTVTDPLPLQLKSNNAIAFSLASNSAARISVRYDDADLNSSGTTAGIDTANSGVQIGPTVSVAANEVKNFSFSATDLHAALEGLHTLNIFAEDQSGDSSLTARTGLRFTYDPPPKAVQFRLSRGDQSVHVLFDAPPGGDIAFYYIYASTNAADLADLDNAPAISIPTVDNKSLSFPIRVQASDWDGRYVISPVANFQEYFVRVQVYDKSDQKSLDPLPAKSIVPYPTLTLPQALGGVASCQLNPRLRASGPHVGAGASSLLEPQPLTGPIFLLGLSLFALLWRRKRS